MISPYIFIKIYRDRDPKTYFEEYIFTPVSPTLIQTDFRLPYISKGIHSHTPRQTHTITPTNYIFTHLYVQLSLYAHFHFISINCKIQNIQTVNKFILPAKLPRIKHKKASIYITSIEKCLPHQSLQHCSIQTQLLIQPLQIQSHIMALAPT